MFFVRLSCLYKLDNLKQKTKNTAKASGVAEQIFTMYIDNVTDPRLSIVAMREFNK